jgi:hypothetical protein
VAGWLAGWLALLLAGGWLLLDVRRRTLDEFAQEAARAQWRAWKDAVERNDPNLGPVARRPPKSDEPPGLVLLRDHFPAVAIGCAVFVSLTYAFFAVALTGLFGTPRAAPPAKRRQPP